MGETTVREAVFGAVSYEDHTYTDDEIRDLFPEGAGSLVRPLLDRAVAAEEERDRLRELLAEVRDCGQQVETPAGPQIMLPRAVWMRCCDVRRDEDDDDLDDDSHERGSRLDRDRFLH